MLRKTNGWAALVLGAALALVPVTAMARDRGEGHGGHWGEERHEAHERWEHERRGDGWSFGMYTGPAVNPYYGQYGAYYGAPAPAPVPPPASGYGYYDQYGNWQPY